MGAGRGAGREAAARSGQHVGAVVGELPRRVAPHRRGDGRGDVPPARPGAEGSRAAGVAAWRSRGEGREGRGRQPERGEAQKERLAHEACFDANRTFSSVSHRAAPKVAGVQDALAVRYGTPRGRWVLLATVLGSGIAALDATVVNIALPAIGLDFHSALTSLPSTVNAYP